MPDAPWQADACSLVDAYRRGERSPAEEVEACLAAIAASDLNAFSFLDGDRAVELARSASTCTLSSRCCICMASARVGSSNESTSAPRLSISRTKIGRFLERRGGQRPPPVGGLRRREGGRLGPRQQHEAGRLGGDAVVRLQGVGA
jgi:hypothetical protein